MGSREAASLARVLSRVSMRVVLLRRCFACCFSERGFIGGGCLHKRRLDELARVGTSPTAFLNHKRGVIRGVAAIYNRHAYFDERRAALVQWAKYVLRLVHSGATKVVVLQR
jgi:hypothetical protein